MNRSAIIVVTAALAVVMSRGVARAQAPAVGDPMAPDQTIIEGAGVRVGEGTVMHPVVGVETGVVDNVFYMDTNGISAPFLRALAELNFASLSQQRIETSPDEGARPDQGDLQWRAGVRVIPQIYLSGNESVTSQDNIALGANLHALVFPQRTWRFGIDNDFIRDNRPTNFESRSTINRDINLLGFAVRYEPDGRALSYNVRYLNRIDVFESSSNAFANRIQHQLGFRMNWQWLPITRVYADVTWGIYGGLGSSSNRNDSFPLRGVIGIQTAITTDTAVNFRVGAGKGFYSAGPDVFQPIVGLQFAYRYSPNGQLLAMYSYDFTDSIQANFFRDHLFEIGENHAFGRVTVATTLDMRLRNYQGINVPGITGPPERSDFLLDFGLSPRYYIQDWFAVTVDYDLVMDSTDYRYMTGGMTINPSYVRNQLLAGVRADW
jgi:hypothetical protein